MSVESLLPRLVAAAAFVIGVGAGGASAARMRGGAVAGGRRCAHCGASLSPVRALPFLSWFGVLPRCRSCGAASGWRHAALEAGAAMVGVGAILALPLAAAVPAIFAGWAIFFVAMRRWG